jgi:hypothetical protein
MKKIWKILVAIIAAIGVLIPIYTFAAKDNFPIIPRFVVNESFCKTHARNTYGATFSRWIRTSYIFGSCKTAG